MNGKTVLVTGATDGIGKMTATGLAKKDATVILHGRNKLLGGEIAEQIKKETGNLNVFYENADLTSLGNVSKLANTVTQKYGSLDVLINNAGVFMRGQTFSAEGIETTFAVNHLAHFALTLQLLPLLLRSPQGRVVTVSSVAHTSSPRIDFSDLQEINSYIDYSAYALSKLANVLFSNELAHLLKESSVTSNSLHPGVITTKLLYAGFGISGSPLEEGARTSVYLASEPALENTNGRYFSNSKEAEPSPYSYDPGTRKNLWDLSEELSGLKFSDFA